MSHALNMSVVEEEPSFSQAPTPTWNNYLNGLQQQQDSERLQREELQRILRAYPQLHRSLDPSIVYMIDNDLRVNKGIVEKLQWVPIGAIPFDNAFSQQGHGVHRIRRKRSTHRKRSTRTKQRTHRR